MSVQIGEISGVPVAEMSIENLQKIEVFRDLTDSALHEVQSRISWSTYPADLTLLTHHEQSTDVYFIATGSVKATTFSFSGKEISYQVLGSGKMFGELSAIDCQGRTTSVLVLEESTIGNLSSEDFWWVLNTYPKTVRPVLLRLTDLIRFLCGRVYEYGALGVNDRIRAEILKHAREASVDGISAVIKGMPTHEEIANRVSTHREAVTKEFSYLYKEGYIEKSGNSLCVSDIQRLSDLIVEDL